MTNRTILTASVLTAVALGAIPAGGAFAAEQSAAPVSASVAASGSDLLSGAPWETTGAVDQDGEDVALTDENVANFVGWAYYNTDGTFTMYNLDDTPKMQGDWAVSPDASERTLVAKDDAGEVMFERVVPITELTEDVFTYRVVPDETATDVYYDIIHTPTDHPEPGTTASADEAETDEDAETTAPADADADADGELADTGNAGPVVAVVAGVIALLGGAALIITRKVRRTRTS
ncbi:DUF4822 domain-containing protein [uncultured Microbacterium sp.]|uniref:DUF4822 domain-containing protein n=1 Tax=uncultured Microbacterium sp. TaxID=191216 RepID=UPI002624D246|nr:DUF4822 domain-containing protein [uncultured Microbacterium sp.]